MSSKAWKNTESFPTTNTFIGFLSSMYNLVHGKPKGPTEGFAALIIFVGFFSRMNSFMLSKQ